MAKYEEWMNPNLEKQMRYHLQEIVQRLDHFAPRQEDLSVEVTIKIAGKKYHTMVDGRKGLSAHTAPLRNGNMLEQELKASARSMIKGVGLL